MKSKTWKPHLLILIILAAGLLFFHLGARPLLSSGEARAGEIAVEMMQRGDFIIPYLNEDILLTKPPLFHWFIILSYKIFGVNEFASRVSSALAGILSVILVYLLGAGFWKKETGFMAALMLVTSPLFFWSARCARIDCLLLFFITASMFCFWRGYCGGARQRIWFLGWFLFMGLGVLAKGPVGIVVPLLTAALFLFYIKRLSFWKQINWGWGLALFFLIVLPWFVAVYFRVPHYKSGLFYLQQNKAWLGGGGEWYKGYVYVVHLLAGFFPWSLALPAVFVFTWSDVKSRKDEGKVFLWCWFLTVFFVFFLFGKKVSRYILPLYPPAALLCAVVVSGRPGINRIFCAALTGLWFFIALAAGLFPFYSGRLDPNLISIINYHICPWWIMVTAILLAMISIYGIRKKSYILPVIISAVSLFMFIQYVIPVEREYYSPKPFCHMMKKKIPEDAVVCAYRSWDNTIRYYFGRHVDVFPPPHKIYKDPALLQRDFLRYAAPKKNLYCIMWEKTYNEAPESITQMFTIEVRGYKVQERHALLLKKKVKE